MIIYMETVWNIWKKLKQKLMDYARLCLNSKTNLNFGFQPGFKILVSFCSRQIQKSPHKSENTVNGQKVNR